MLQTLRLPPSLANDIKNRVSRRWSAGLSINGYYYYDEPVPSERLIEKKKQGFPPLFVNLSAAWVVRIVEFDLLKKDRAKAYPSIFTGKGLKSDYINVGQARKSCDNY